MRVTAAEAGGRVFDSLMEHSPPGLTIQELQIQTRLKRSQVRRGIEYIRTELATDKGEPLVFDPKTNRYAMAVLERESTEYVTFRLKVGLVQIRRLQTATVIPSERKFGKTHTVQRLADDLGRVERDLQLLLDEASGSMPLFHH